MEQLQAMEVRILELWICEGNQQCNLTFLYISYICGCKLIRTGCGRKKPRRRTPASCRRSWPLWRTDTATLQILQILQPRWSFRSMCGQFSEEHGRWNSSELKICTYWTHDAVGIPDMMDARVANQFSRVHGWWRRAWPEHGDMIK